MKTLMDFSAGHPGKTLVLLSCSDGYTIRLARNRAALEPYYKFACPTEENVMNLDMKEYFYKACEKHGLSYPKTSSCTSGTRTSARALRTFRASRTNWANNSLNTSWTNFTLRSSGTCWAYIPFLPILKP